MRKTLAEVLAAFPVRGDGFAVNQPGGGVEEGAGADAGLPLGLAGGGFELGEQGGIGAGGVDAVAADGEQRVAVLRQWREVGEGLGVELEACRTADRPAVLAAQVDLVAGGAEVVGGFKGGDWPGDIEQLKARVEEEAQGSRHGRNSGKVVI